LFLKHQRRRFADPPSRQFQAGVIMIEARALARSYRTRRGEVPAVTGVDLLVEAGEIVGFLGPNGAGKTTTVRMLTTLLAPTAGSATVAGFDVLRERAQVRARIGYVSQAGGPSDHRVFDELVVQGRLHGMSRATARQRAVEVCDEYELDGLADRPLTRLSGGQRRRFDIAAGVLHQPAVLFLDEPTASLDPHSRANLWEHIRAMRADRGTTVFLTTHHLDEADVLCDRVLIIDAGRIIAQDTPEALKASVGGDAVTLRTADVAVAATVVENMLGGGVIDCGADTVQFHIACAANHLPTLLRELDRAGVALDAVSTSRPSLDDVFLRLTGRSLREGSQPGAPAAASTAALQVTKADQRVPTADQHVAAAGDQLVTADDHAASTEYDLEEVPAS